LFSATYSYKVAIKFMLCLYFSNQSIAIDYIIKRTNLEKIQEKLWTNSC
jgi:hypothetical protein